MPKRNIDDRQGQADKQFFHEGQNTILHILDSWQYTYIYGIYLIFLLNLSLKLLRGLRRSYAPRLRWLRPLEVMQASNWHKGKLHSLPQLHAKLGVPFSASSKTYFLNLYLDSGIGECVDTHWNSYFFNQPATLTSSCKYLFVSQKK